MRPPVAENIGVSSHAAYEDALRYLKYKLMRPLFTAYSYSGIYYIYHFSS